MTDSLFRPPEPASTRLEHAPAPLSYFDRVYARSDPYGTRTRWYERRKRRLTLDALPRERFSSAFEPACGSGALTVELSRHCDALLSSDFCEGALRQARQDALDCRQVVLSRHQVPAQWPTAAGPFDLIVLSELCSFLNADDVRRLSARCHGSLAPDGVLVACDWRWPFDARVLGAEQAHQELEAAGLPRLVRHEEADFLLTVWAHDARSVAQREGIVA